MGLKRRRYKMPPGSESFPAVLFSATHGGCLEEFAKFVYMGKGMLSATLARIWRLPAGSVCNLSPEKMVVPAEAFPVPRWAVGVNNRAEGRRGSAKEVFAAENKIKLKRGLRASAPFPIRIVSKIGTFN